jgi:hypothetical protein
MAFPLRATSVESIDEAPRTAPACRVHTCVRCRSVVASGEPCSFLPAVRATCPACKGQQEALAHLPLSRTHWANRLAATRRA